MRNHSRTTRAALLALATVGAAALAAPARADGKADVSGVVGVCIRWGDDPTHVQEAVVVKPSDNAALNQAVPAHVRSMDWPKPAKGYNGEWEGVNLVFGDVSPQRLVPDCKALNRERVQR